MRARQRGVAVILALLVTALALLLVSGAFARQSVLVRSVEQGRAAVQTRWLMTGAVDWIRVILREDARRSATDHAGEPWAAPLARTRLEGGGGAAAWLSGRIEDAQSRFNLRNLSGPRGPELADVAILGRLLILAGADETLAADLADAVDRQLRGGEPGVPRLLPALAEELALPEGRPREALSRLLPFVVLLPEPTPVNVNTASAEVLSACLANLPLAEAVRLVESRQERHFRDLADLQSRLPGLMLGGDGSRVSVSSRYFLVRGQVDYRDASLAHRVLLHREGNGVETIWTREEDALLPVTGPGSSGAAS